MKKLFTKRHLYGVCVFFVCSCGCLLYLHHTQKSQNSKKTKLSEIFVSIPPPDLVILEDFFQSLFVYHNLGYVLYGDKPMITISYNNPLFSQSFDLYSMEPENLKMKKGMECWRKYHKLFSSENFISVFFGDPSKDENIELILINKSKFINVVETNLDKFKPVFGKDVTGKQLLTKLINEKDFWTCNLDYEMIGILLGYGKINAHYFQRRSDINPKFYGWKFTLKKLLRSPSPGYTCIEDEMVDLQNCFHPLEDDNHLDGGFMDLPGFLAVDSTETQKLKEDFEQQRKQMIKIYRNGSYFKKSMRKYVGSDSSNRQLLP